MRASRPLRPALSGSVIALMAACSSVPQSGAPAGVPLASAAANAPGVAARPAASGRISIRQWPNLTIDDKALLAAPGARIFNSNNLMLTPNMVPDGTRVAYELDAMGQVRVIRVLDAAGATTGAAPRSPLPASR
jgi:hypothetical protein